MLLEFIIVMAIAAAVLWFVSGPLRPGGLREAAEIDPRLLADRDRAQLAKDRKLDEIRELRADRAAGKIAPEDAAPLERKLRAEAADLLHALDAAEAAIDEAQAELDLLRAAPSRTDAADDAAPDADASTPAAAEPGPEALEQPGPLR